MGKNYLADALAWLTIAIWFFYSAYLFIMGDADLFQRLGALGIVIGVIYYALAPPPVVHPVGQLEAQLWRDKTQLGLANGVLSAQHNVSLLAASLVAKFERENMEVPQSIRELARSALDSLNAGEPYPQMPYQDLKLERILESQIAADSTASNVERVRFLTQAFLVATGTIQSGFGSLVVPT